MATGGKTGGTQGIDTIVINYRNQNGSLVNEVLRFDDDGRVIEGHGTYLAGGLTGQV